MYQCCEVSTGSAQGTMTGLEVGNHSCTIAVRSVLVGNWLPVLS